MTKRDDDSQADMEVGMTTAERRRRRRRGGLRVPSDNVPRRSSAPPVVAPVPDEDPGLAMSIAYSFTAESSEPVARAPRDSVPGFENHEVMPTVIDPPSGPVEQDDFEMKTREMTAVDLDELGLSELMPGGLAMGRATLRDLEPIAMSSSSASDGEAAVIQRELTDPDAVEVDLDASGVELDAVVDAGMTLDQDGDGPARRVVDVDADIEIDSIEPTAIHPRPPAPPVEIAARAETSQPRTASVMPAVPVAPVIHEASGPRAAPIAPGAGEPPRPIGHEASGPRATPPTGPLGGIRTGRAQTFALTEDDLEEVREAAARLASQPVIGPSHPPPAALSSLSSGGAGPPSYPSLPPTRPASTSIPPPMPPTKVTRPRITAPVVVPTVPAVPAIPSVEIRPVERSEMAGGPAGGSAAKAPRGIDAKVAEAATEFEVDVDGIVETKPAGLEGKPAEPPPMIPSSTQASPTAIPPMAIPGPPVPPPGPPAPPAPREAPPMGPAREAVSPSVQPGTQPSGIPTPGPPAPPPPPPPRDSPLMGAQRDGHGQPPPMPRSPPSPPPAVKKDRPAAVAARPDAREGRDQRELRELRDAKPDGKQRGKPWFVDLFDEDYLRTLPFLTPQATQAEAEFVINALGLQPGAQVLDVGCGYGRHAMELAARGYHVVGLDLSTPLLVRGGEEAHRRGLTIHFLREDMREIDFDAQFDGAYCLFSTFGYFDDETNKKAVANMARALRPGGRLLIEILNRDYVIADLPTRVWWEGDGCVVLEEVELNYFSSRIQVNRSVVFDDGRQLEQEISVRAYSLHEVGKLLHSAGLRVLEVSGAYHTRGRFFGNQSRHIIVLAERKDPTAG